MIRSLYSGVSGMKSHQTRMDVVGNNISNVNTTGYKSGTVNFQDTLSQTIRSGGDGRNPSQVGTGISVGSVSNDFGQGSLQNTGRTLDLAINGRGLFVVSDGNESFYSRNGAFFVDKNGYLVNSDGFKVQSTEGDIRIYNGPVSNLQIEPDGAITGTNTDGEPLQFSSDPVIIPEPTQAEEAQLAGNAMQIDPVVSGTGSLSGEGIEPATLPVEAVVKGDSNSDKVDSRLATTESVDLTGYDFKLSYSDGADNHTISFETVEQNMEVTINDLGSIAASIIGNNNLDTTVDLSGINAGTSVDIIIDGGNNGGLGIAGETIFTFDDTTLKSAFNGTNPWSDIKIKMESATSSNGTKLSEVANIELINNKLSITSKSTGSSSTVQFDITDGAGDTADIESAFGIDDLSNDTGIDDAADGYVTFTDIPSPGATLNIAGTTIEFYDSINGQYSGTNTGVNINGLSTAKQVADKVATDVTIPNYTLDSSSVDGQLDIDADNDGAVTKLANIGTISSGNVDVGGNDFSATIDGAYGGYTLEFIDADQQPAAAIDHSNQIISLTADFSGNGAGVPSLDNIKSAIEAETGTDTAQLQFNGTIDNNFGGKTIDLSANLDGISNVKGWNNLAENMQQILDANSYLKDRVIVSYDDGPYGGLNFETITDPDKINNDGNPITPQIALSGNHVEKFMGDLTANQLTDSGNAVKTQDWTGKVFNFDVGNGWQKAELKSDYTNSEFSDDWSGTGFDEVTSGQDLADKLQTLFNVMAGDDPSTPDMEAQPNIIVAWENDHLVFTPNPQDTSKSVTLGGPNVVDFIGAGTNATNSNVDWTSKDFSITYNGTTFNFSEYDKQQAGLDAVTSGDALAAAMNKLIDEKIGSDKVDVTWSSDHLLFKTKDTTGLGTVPSISINGTDAADFVGTNTSDTGNPSTQNPPQSQEPDNVIRLVTFSNLEGLAKAGNNLYSQTESSGIPSNDTQSTIESNYLEMSNVDLTEQFTDMITTQRGYQAGSRMVTVSDSMLEELINLKR